MSKTHEHRMTYQAGIAVAGQVRSEILASGHRLGIDVTVARLGGWIVQTHAVTIRHESEATAGAFARAVDQFLCDVRDAA